MSNAAAVQSIYQAFGTGDVPAILERLSDDIEWEHDSIDHGIPWLKPGRGKEHVRNFFGIVGREFKISRFDVGALFESADQVVVQIRIQTTINSTGKSINDYELHVWTFDPRGKVKAFRHCVDTHQHYQTCRK